MDNYLIPSEDMQYLVSESNNNLNMILAGMTYLLEDNNDKVSMLENQTWFQRMSKTITGKNKMTQEEIARNHDQINLYATQAMAELFNRNCIDHEIMLCLGNKINELYESQIEIKQIIGAFAQKLNQKIESIDNYHMLITEINQGVYTSPNRLAAVSRIMSQLDLRTVEDDRKMEVLTRALEEQKILDRSEMTLLSMLEELLLLSENEAGLLALFYGNIREEYLAEIIEQTICAYYMLPEKIRKMKSRRSVIENVLKSNEIDIEYSVSSYEICEMLISAYKDNIIQVAIEEKKSEEESKKDFVEKYILNSKDLLEMIYSMVPTWEAKNGEMNLHKSRLEYSRFINTVIDNLDEASYVGKAIRTSLCNMTYFAQRICAQYEQLYIYIVHDNPVNSNFAIKFYDGIYYTVIEHFNRIRDMYDNSELGRTKALYSIETMEAIAKEFPSPSYYNNYTCYLPYMEYYVELFEDFFDELEEILYDSRILNEAYNLCKKFPVEYDANYYNIFFRELDLSAPYIEIQYTDTMGSEECSEIGHAFISALVLNDFDTTTLIIKFKNMQEQVSPIFRVMKNEYVDTSSWSTYEYVSDIEWGDWVDEDAIELKITKMNAERWGTLHIKIGILERDDVVAYLE